MHSRGSGLVYRNAQRSSRYDRGADGDDRARVHKATLQSPSVNTQRIASDAPVSLTDFGSKRRLGGHVPDPRQNESDSAVVHGHQRSDPNRSDLGVES
jgi:hypothetical protein